MVLTLMIMAQAAVGVGADLDRMRSQLRDARLVVIDRLEAGTPLKQEQLDAVKKQVLNADAVWTYCLIDKTMNAEKPADVQAAATQIMDACKNDRAEAIAWMRLALRAHRESVTVTEWNTTMARSYDRQMRHIKARLSAK